MAPSSSTSGSDDAPPVRPVSRVRKTPETVAEPGELSIGELAELTSVSTRTIRYYEELGILPAPSRTPGGTRRYSRDYIFYVEGAKTLKQLGFGLDQLAELGTFALTGAAASERTQTILQEKLSDLDHRIRILNRLHDIVAAATSKNGNGSPVPELLRWVSSESGINDPAG